MKYFVYSRIQHKEQSKIAEKINKKYVPGKVHTKGTYMPYTEIIDDSSASRYSDAVTVVKVESTSDIDYTYASFELR
jgi:hypothetical protein